MPLLLNLWTWTVTVLLVLVGFVAVSLVFLVTAPFDPGRYAAGWVFRKLAVVQVALNPFWRFRTEGARVRDPRHPYVAVANHESYADIFLISHLPWDMKWLSKDTIFKIPVFGWMMTMAGDVRLVRGNRSSAADALAACRDRLAKRVSVMIFPEGTRSRGDDLLPFKDGAFRLAVEMGVPILPIAVAGTRHAMAKGSFRFRRAEARCVVLEPVPTTGLTAGDVPALKAAVRARIAEARDALRRELAGHHWAEG
ncbi:MAG TPA: lysophospholipid acyltransferase family protein [Gemmatimonadaceae bacterium]|nr:lysophospholipid acyltransferase family protein [Gemmatimonadaceae bacterium]